MIIYIRGVFYYTKTTLHYSVNYISIKGMYCLNEK